MQFAHIFWLFLWVVIFKQKLALPTAAAIPAIAVCTFVCCLLSAKLVSYIPGSNMVYRIGGKLSFHLLLLSTFSIFAVDCLN